MSSKIPFDVCGFYQAARTAVHDNRPGREFSPRSVQRLNRLEGVQRNTGGEWPPKTVEVRCGSCALQFFAELSDGRVKKSGILETCQKNLKAAERSALAEAERIAKAQRDAERAARKAAEKAAEMGQVVQAPPEQTAPEQAGSNPEAMAEQISLPPTFEA